MNIRVGKRENTEDIPPRTNPCTGSLVVPFRLPSTLLLGVTMKLNNWSGSLAEKVYEVSVMSHTDSNRSAPPPVTLYTSTQYWMSGSAVVRFREKGGSHEIVIAVLDNVSFKR